MTSSQHQYVVREVSALQSLNHQFIANYFGLLQSKRKIILMLEYIEGGELWSYLNELRYNNMNTRKFKLKPSPKSNAKTEERNSLMPLYQSTLYVSMVMLALQHVHEHGFCYRDLKSENLLITSTGYLKLIDFGFAKEVPFVNKNQKIQYRTFTLCGKFLISFVFACITIKSTRHSRIHCT